jgi:hypothetical protein
VEHFIFIFSPISTADAVMAKKKSFMHKRKKVVSCSTTPATPHGAHGC